MKVPQLWQKWQHTMALTGVLAKIFRHGIGSVFGFDTATLSRMKSRSCGRIRASSFGELAATACQTRNQTSPSEPNVKKTLGHSKRSIICGDRARPVTEPMNIPEYTSARLRERSSPGTHLERMLFIAGIATPSPTPMHARAARSAGKPSRAAIGVSIVATDHHTTPNPSTAFPPTRSANTPPATCVSRYPQKKLLCTNPIVACDHPNSSAIGSTAMDMFTLSILHSKNAVKHIPTTKNRF
mmetsp:Transcript_28317/g.92451  ORF Transcript_28317/g.92451 Transcript_28317/m.92451 type:complete len:241 (-) Transcript_28317:315-1037(-)